MAVQEADQPLREAQREHGKNQHRANAPSAALQPRRAGPSHHLGGRHSVREAVPSQSPASRPSRRAGALGPARLYRTPACASSAPPASLASGHARGREGPVAERLRVLDAAARRDLVEQLREARAAGEIDSAADLEQLAFEIDSLVLGAHSAFLLFSDPADVERARRAVRARLR